MHLAKNLIWKIIADNPPKWGKKTTKEDLEKLHRTKHTPGKKKKRGRSQHKDKYSKEFREHLEKGKKCGNSYIAKEDECHQDEVDLPEGKKAEEANPPKRPRVKKDTPHHRVPKKAKQPGGQKERFQTPGAPKYVSSPKGGNGVLRSSGYLSGNIDGIYDMESSPKPHRIYFPEIMDQAAAQYVSSAIADMMGLSVHDDYLFRNERSDQVAAGHAVLPFSELDELQLKKLVKNSPDIAGWFVHSVLVRHDDAIGADFNNIVLLDTGKPSILHFGGTLLWASSGLRRADGMLPDALPELENFRTFETNWQAATVFGDLEEKSIISAINTYLSPVTEKDILDVVDAASFSPEDRIEIGKGIISRKRLLESL